MIIKSPLPGSEALPHKVQERLGPNRLPLLIAIDGADGVGKSSLASWLAWQLGAPAIHLDLYLVRDSDPLRWRCDELQAILNTRLVEHAKPVIVEGIGPSFSASTLLRSSQSKPARVLQMPEVGAVEHGAAAPTGRAQSSLPLLLNEEPPGGVRGGCDSWENLRNLLKRNGPIWHQLGK